MHVATTVTLRYNALAEIREYGATEHLSETHDGMSARTERCSDVGPL
jgi:hypothetical protein